MKRCAACGTFLDPTESPEDHGHVETYTPLVQPDARIGNAVQCDVSALWSDTEMLPGIVVSGEKNGYRILIALPGDRGAVSAVTLPEDKVSW